ncbi:hypothetical protein PHYBLDRAFT_146020 [Phycomyces blakesleeanus NRRL 1555(-)]|uniref:SWIM-type domain-containing protein n=1 Tax=Phycomyces blakesleeanus (strain ATCC 8743b / DSM 1359 / FGSC 10004 / NBRC 33097 / NRRL 1555) TaxID=763407 RepID=A0A162X5Y0_PHYB8|nr:hypothetical protein PHYBLDRAFT_146020 [Phycomyces blakesleeanus NRRL 1555(-)]OAD72705.1 hypothetical protein PHYBLDRAFT_146020 [Phycomyces blakesleeanus NRRL 1555(-)]|eukprot:XP_018290745.1 hypothetical protein PHYBLDRAFT_146020 [Phycomyces blakesleeanus NRRL 1555(-)]
MDKGVPVCFFVTNAELITTLSQWLSWVKSNCSLHVKCVIIDCSPVEIGALEKVFGQSVQVLLCYWHIKRAWEMHIKKDIKEAFYQQYDKFVSKFAGHEKFVAYFATHWHAKRDLWSMTWRLDARFHTNNLIESYHHILKAYYLRRSRNFWIIYGFKKLVLTHVEKAKKKKTFDVAHKDVLCMIETVEDNLLLVKEEVLSVCSCPDSNHLCKHIFLVCRMMGLQYSLTKELPIVQNPEVQVVERNEESAAAQNELHLLELDEVSESLFKKLEQAFRKQKAENLKSGSGMDVTSQVLRDCLSLMEETGVASQQKFSDNVSVGNEEIHNSKSDSDESDNAEKSSGDDESSNGKESKDDDENVVEIEVEEFVDEDPFVTPNMPENPVHRFITTFVVMFASHYVVNKGAIVLIEFINKLLTI